MNNRYPVMRRLDGWRQIVRDEREMVRVIKINQSTMRGCGVIPTWENFSATNYARDVKSLLDGRMMRKFRSWWILLYECGDVDRGPGKSALGFAWAFLVSEIMARKHGKFRVINPTNFGLAESRGEALKERVLMMYGDLTLC